MQSSAQYCFHLIFIEKKSLDLFFLPFYYQQLYPIIKNELPLKFEEEKKYNNLRVFIAVTPFGVVSVIQNLVRKNKIKTKAFL